ncbi:hypothetical protein BTVI_63728 [Pitangus sulphuratus]|nr:hypothetical protein BTVI_63728 [Pitangus sulphuratus]
MSRAPAGPAVPDDVCSLLADVETFISQILKGENLSKKAKERRELLLKKIEDVKASYSREFPEEEPEDEDKSENSLSSPPDSVSIASYRYDKEDEAPSDEEQWRQSSSDLAKIAKGIWLRARTSSTFSSSCLHVTGSLLGQQTLTEERMKGHAGPEQEQANVPKDELVGKTSPAEQLSLELREKKEWNQFSPVAAQDLQFVLKAGYLEKRRKDHSFLGFEWQKRWCAISKTVFYYYGSDKDKQQKGEFALEGYTIRMNNSLRKDAKKDCCFEISAPDKRIYQFTAATPKEAEEWVEQIQFVIQDTSFSTIPEEEEYDDVGQENSELTDECIYEELKDSENIDYANFYLGLWDCTGDVPDELTFKRGDVIYILSKEYDEYGWWVGEMKGTVGLVPKAYIMEMYDI